MNVIERPLEEVIPYERNPRVNDQAVKAVMASIQEFGFRQPIVVDSAGVIIVGHTRWKAAKNLGLKTVPVHVATGLTAEQVAAYRIADNQTATIADWDQELLLAELLDLREADFDLQVLGFDDAELAAMLATESNAPTAGQTDPDDVPAATESRRCKPGDIWIMGRHRLVCADAASLDDVTALLNGDTPALVWVDPPGKTGDAPSSDLVVQQLLPVLQNAVTVMDADGTLFVCGSESGDTAISLASVMRDCSLPVRLMIIWDKGQSIDAGASDYVSRHEPLLVTWGQGHRYYGAGEHRSTVWRIDRPDSLSVHPDIQPTALVANALLNNTVPGDVVLDPMAGTGTTILAAEMFNRSCFAVEIDPECCDLAISRWEAYTGLQAIRSPRETGSDESKPTRRRKRKSTAK